MRAEDGALWRILESWSSTAFLIAAVLLFVFVVLTGVTAFTNLLGHVPMIGAALVGSGLLGLVVAVVGVLGLYPRLREPAPWLSRAALGALGGALTGVIVVIGTIAVVGPPEAPGDVPSFVPPIFIISGLLIMLGIASIAAASIRTRVPSRRVGILLVVPVAVLLWHYAALPVFGSQPLLDVLDYTIISAAFLTIGYRLRTETVSNTSTEPRRDSTP